MKSSITSASFYYTKNQKKIRRSVAGPKPLTVIEGPAGTGKTMVTLDSATRLLDDFDNKYETLVVTRPLVGVMQEQIGYLPGTVEDKSAPWVDVIYAYANRPFKFVPLTFMRGHTWDNAVILADEMQNSTSEQMKTLLTRVGHNSKLIINGDTGQSDIHGENGLKDLRERLLCMIDDEQFDLIELDASDIKRSPFVKYVHELYELTNENRAT